MDPLFFLFGSAFVIGLSGAMMPGPVLTATVAETLRQGFRAGPLIVFGHAVLELAVLTAVVAGLGTLLRRPTVLAPLGVAGGTLLIVMGAHTAWRARKAADETRAMTAGVGAPAPAAWRGPMAAGVVLSLANPYWLLWWCTIGLHYAALALRQGPVGLGVFYAGHIASDLAWYSAVAAAVAAGRRVFPPAVHRALLTACGLALVALGAWFLGDGAGRFPSVFHGAAAAP